MEASVPGLHCSVCILLYNYTVPGVPCVLIMCMHQIFEVEAADMAPQLRTRQKLLIFAIIYYYNNYNYNIIKYIIYCTYNHNTVTQL